MNDDTSRRLLAIQDEQRAQKASTVLNYGQLNMPDSIPQATWYGYVAATSADLAASWVAKFTRSDGVGQPPYVEFPWTFNLEQWFYDDPAFVGPGKSVTGRDKRAVDEHKFNDGAYEIGTNFTSWRIDIDSRRWPYSSGTNVTITIQAISMVPGTLTLTRVV